MKIGVIGATGKAGSRLLKEAISRGHEATAIVRDRSRLTGNQTDVLEKDVLALEKEDLTTFDVVVNAFGAPLGSEHLHAEVGDLLIQLLKDAPRTRLIVVGGAGSLYADESRTVRVIDTEGFPAFVRPTALGQAENLARLQQSEGVRWTFISPSAHFALGQRTGAYKTGTDVLLTNKRGESYVSYEDFAVAVLDEIEYPKHINERFTVVSESE